MVGRPVFIYGVLTPTRPIRPTRLAPPEPDGHGTDLDIPLRFR